MEWIKLETQDNINNLMNDFYEFHDSCIKECSYITGMYVDEKKNMGQDSTSSIKLLYQSQLCNSIEICFEDIKEVNIHTYDNNNYFNNISDATFFIEDGFIYWANILDWDKSNDNNEITYIICKKAKYRKVI